MRTYAKFGDLLKEASNYKKASRGTAELTESEVQRAYRIYKKGKLSEGHNRRPTRAAHKENRLDIMQENFQAYKLQAFREGRVDTPKLTLKDLSLLKGLCERATQRGIILKEATENLTTEMPAAQGQDVTGQMDPNAGMDTAMGDPNAQQPALSQEELQATIQSLLAQVQTLAQQAGVPTTEMQADPNAQIAPDMSAQGDPNADVNAAGAAQEPALAETCKIWHREHPGEAMSESTFKDIKHRIDERDNHLETFKERMAMRNASNKVLQSKLEESGVQDYARAYFDFIGQSTGAAARAHVAEKPQDPNMNYTSTSAMAKGTVVGEPGSKKAKINWNGLKTPRTTKGTGPEMPGANPKNAIHESVTEKYLREAAEPKLNFDEISAQFNKGLLG